MKSLLKWYQQDKYFAMFAGGALLVAIGLLVFAILTAISDYHYWRTPN